MADDNSPERHTLTPTLIAVERLKNAKIRVQ